MIMLRLGRLEVQVVPGVPSRALFTGRIDDSVSVGELIAKLPAGDVALDTDGVTFVNSVGMREWMRLLRALRERGSRITLERVADVLITQMNMIPDAVKGTAIASFHAQYACPACGAESAPLVDVAAHAKLLQELQAPRLPCHECNAPMELADFPERYLTVFRG
jgi:hypothetical protein